MPLNLVSLQESPPWLEWHEVNRRFTLLRGAMDKVQAGEMRLTQGQWRELQAEYGQVYTDLCRLLPGVQP